MNTMLKVDSDDIQVANPFVHSIKISPAKRIQLWIFGAILVPFRILGMLVFFLLTSLIGELTTKQMDFTKPMSGFRKHVLLPIFIFFGRLLFFSGGFHWVSIKGKRASTVEAPIMVLAPHSSYFDSLVFVALGMPSVVGKTETANSPIGCLIKMTQPILVNREDPMSRQNTLQEIRNRSRSNGVWQQILIFPEGTCTNRSCLINFKQGAFSSGIPVQPAILHWHQPIDTITWTWDGPGVWELLWMTIIQPHTRLGIEFLPVYTPSEEEIANPQLYADNVRKVMAQALNLPTTDLSFDDCRRIRTAVLFSLPMACYIHDYGKLTQALFFDSSQSKKEPRAVRVTARLSGIVEAARQWHLLGCSPLTQHLVESMFFPGCEVSDKQKTLLRCIVNTLPKTTNDQPDLRVLAIHVCMLMFTDPPIAAFRHAFQAFDSDSSNSAGDSLRGDERLSDWSISPDDAAKLLYAAYRMPLKEAKLLLKNHALQLASSSGVLGSLELVMRREEEEELSSGIASPSLVYPDALYTVLTAEIPDLVHCYAKYKAEMTRIRRRAERPFSDTASASNSTSSICSLNPALKQHDGVVASTNFLPGHNRNISNTSVNSTNSLDFELESKEQDVRFRCAETLTSVR